MNVHEFMQGVHLLQDNYNKKLSKEQLMLFYENLKDMPKEKYTANIKSNIRSNLYFPNIAQIRGENLVKVYSNFDERDYSNFDFNKIFSN